VMKGDNNMNVNGYARGLMSRNMDGEKYLEHIAKIMELQLKEWDEEYEVMVMKLVNYEWVINNKDIFYHVELSDQDLQVLQKKDPFAIDRKLWLDLEKQGLPIIKGVGNYLDRVMG
jgi:hypothetical protein